MPEFPIKVKSICTQCGSTIKATIPDGMTLEPQIPNMEPLHFTLEDMKNGTSKLLKNKQGHIMGKMDMKDAAFDIFCKTCNKEYRVPINDFEFLY